MKTSLIIPYEKNAKKHPKKQVEQIAASIREFGFNQPIVVDKNNVIIVGHGRFEAAKLLGLDEVPAIQLDLTEQQAKSYRLADNKLNETDWDMELVIEELKTLDENYLELSGFDADLIIELDEKDDEAPKAPNEPQSKLGDLYELGVHRLLCGDSTNIESVEKLMDGKKADMVFTDPPYGVDYVSRVDIDKRKDWGGIKNDDLKGKELQSFINDALGYHWQSASKYICCNWQSVKDFFEAIGMPNSLIVWDKKSIGLGANYRSQHEFILFWGKLNHRNESNVWSLKRDPTGEYTHPTQKPVELIVRAIINSSEEDNLVFDAFLGSGSTLIAAQKSNRKCYGMELDPKYVDVIVQRYVDYTGNEKIIKNGNPIKWQVKKQTD